MAVGLRRVSALLGVLAAAAVLVSAGSAGSRANAPSPSLYFMYAMNCTFTIQNDAGQVVTSIPPGNYQVDVRTPLAFGTVPLQVEGITDMTACKGFPQFQLTGPGVNLSTTMTAGCSAELTFGETFQPNATYVAQDNNQPSVTRTVFTTTASGAPTAPGAFSTSGKSTTTSSSDDIVGSGLQPVIATLSAKLASNGKLTLTSKGKAVSSLKAGRYTFSVVDQDPKASWIILGPKMKSPTNLSGVKFVGKRSKTIRLTVGRWMYYSALKQIHYLVVTR
jgi:hypothetical protein